LKELIVKVGNIVDEEVKVDNNEDNNIVYNEWGKTVKGKVPYWDIL
jgi:seryl-tRNA synthetase